MVRLKHIFFVVLLGFCLFSGLPVIGESQVGNETNIQIDLESGLKMASGWEIVKTNCTGCHSARLIIFQRGDRGTWLAIIRWMQKTQGLWNFDERTENTILSYLSTNYPPGKPVRRRNLPIDAMPLNPWLNDKSL